MPPPPSPGTGRAAERGDAVAQLNLGDLLSQGVGAPRDVIAAHVWLSLAAARGRRWAADAVARLERTMTGDEIAAARARRAAWRRREPERRDGPGAAAGQ